MRVVPIIMEMMMVRVVAIPVLMIRTVMSGMSWFLPMLVIVVVTLGII